MGMGTQRRIIRTFSDGQPPKQDIFFDSNPHFRFLEILLKDYSLPETESICNRTWRLQHSSSSKWLLLRQCPISNLLFCSRMTWTDNRLNSQRRKRRRFLICPSSCSSSLVI